MNHPRKLLASFSLMAGAAVALGDTTPAWVESLHLTAAASTQWTENISRTSFEPTRQNAASYDLSLSAVVPRQLAPDWLLTVGATADYVGVPKFSLTDNFNIGPQAGLQRKFGLGPLAPVLQFSTAYTYKAARYAPDRGGTLEANLRLSKRLSSAVKVGISGQWMKHSAESHLFDIQQRTISADISWDIDEHWRLSGSAGRLQGTLVANAADWVYYGVLGGSLGPVVAKYYDEIPWETTGLYGPDWISYTVGAHADLWSVALAYAATDRTTLELRDSSVFVVNDVGIRYPTNTVGLCLIHRF